MSLDEFKLLLIFFVVFCVCVRFFSRNPILMLLTFFFFCVMGFAAQLALGRELNRYTPNITLYISYVSLAVIVAWGTGFSFLWAPVVLSFVLLCLFYLFVRCIQNIKNDYVV